jgi:hypothetical protein
VSETPSSLFLSAFLLSFSKVAEERKEFSSFSRFLKSPLSLL